MHVVASSPLVWLLTLEDIFFILLPEILINQQPYCKRCNGARGRTNHDWKLFILDQYGAAVAAYLVSATVYIAKDGEVLRALADLRYLAYLVPILVGVKRLAVAAVPWLLSVAIRDLAYAGIFFCLLLAVVASLVVRKSGAAVPAAAGLVDGPCCVCDPSSCRRTTPCAVLRPHVARHIGLARRRDCVHVRSDIKPGILAPGARHQRGLTAIKKWLVPMTGA